MLTPDPIPALKEGLARAVVDRLHGWSQEMAAAIIETNQPRMSNLRRGRLGRFSLERLIRFASCVGADVHLTLTWTARRRFLFSRAVTSANALQLEAGRRDTARAREAPER